MARLQFGSTWWGAHWLDAFSRIDNSNRLPRGKTYARNGSVKSVEIKGNKIRAKVQGSSFRPYKVEINIPKFTDGQKKTVIETIKKNPFFLSKLLSYEVPPKLNEQLIGKGISIFPKRWSDIQGFCSCPDSALPCKHLAAIVYLVANEIDKNPFVIFSLHGFDLPKELEKIGNRIGSQKQTTFIRSVDEILKKEVSRNNPSQETDQEETILDKIDFSKLKNMETEVFSLLSEDDLFYSSSFRVLLRKVYNKTQKNISKTKMEITMAKKRNEQHATEYHRFRLILDKHLIITEGTLKNDSIFSFGGIDFAKSLDKLTNYLAMLPEEELKTYTPETQWLWSVFRFSFELMEKNAYVPEIIELEKGLYKIIYTPFLANSDVSDLFQKLSQSKVAEEIIGLRFDKKGISYPDLQEQTKLIISKMIGSFMEASHQGISLSDKGKIHPPEDKEIERLFFTDSAVKLNTFGLENIPKAVYKWLSKLHLNKSPYTPIIKIEEAKDLNKDFSIDINIESTKKGTIEKPRSLKETFEDQTEDIMELLHNLSILSEQFEELETIISSGGKKKVELSSDEFAQILLEKLPVIKLLGVKILLPKGMEDILSPRISLKASRKKGSTTSSLTGFLSLGDMLDFNWRIAIGDKTYKVEEFKKLLKNSRGLVKIHDQYVMVDHKTLEKLFQRTDSPPSIYGPESIQNVISEEYEGAKMEIDQSVREMIKELTKEEETNTPKEILADLRPYQARGYQWLYKNSRIGLGSLLADDMGLGKTLQVITFLTKLKEEGFLEGKPALVVAPTTLLTNWLKEIMRFSPTLEVSIYHGTKRKEHRKNTDVVITTYALARIDQSFFKKQDWSAVILDEAQNIKNHTSSTSKAIKSIPGKIRIAMTGTPVENRLEEYWSISEFLNKGYLGNFSSFQQNYSIPISHDRNHQAIERFQKVTKPIILRRLKTDTSIISDLPSKVETDHYPSLTKEQSALYQSTLDRIMEEVEKEEGFDRRATIFKLINALKQICNHPSQYLKKDDPKEELSGKSALLLELMKTIYENNEKVLIFTQYREMGELLVKMLQNNFKTEPLFLHGGVSREKRDTMVERFQNDPYYKIMILSLKAGGTGLNLTSASHVIHYDLWWNPAVEAQATDRAYRIGQNKNVMVYRFVTKGTFEEKINTMIASKKELASLTVQTGEGWIGDLTNEELKDMFELEKNT